MTYFPPHIRGKAVIRITGIGAVQEYDSAFVDALVGTGIGTFGTLRDNWIFDFKGNPAFAQDLGEEPRLVPSQCPYCGVGCHTYHVVQGGNVVASVPDKDSTVNLGMQCIKGLTASEALYVDRLAKVLVRRDLTNLYQYGEPNDQKFIGLMAEMGEMPTSYLIFYTLCRTKARAEQQAKAEKRDAKKANALADASKEPAPEGDKPE